MNKKLAIWSLLAFSFFSFWFLSGVTAPRLNASGLCSCFNAGIFIYYYFSILNSSPTTVSVSWQSNKRPCCEICSPKFCTAAIACFFTSCVYSITITQEISVFLDDTPVLLVMAGTGAFVYIAVSSFFPVPCLLRVLCYVISCFLMSSRCFDKLPVMRSCTAAGAKILVTQRTFRHSSLAIFDALANCACLIVWALCSHGAVSLCGMEHRVCNLVGMRVKVWLCLQPNFVAYVALCLWRAKLVSRCIEALCKCVCL